MKRKIEIDIAKQYLQQVYYRPKGTEKTYFGLGWPCNDGYEMRSLYFKGFIGTKKGLIKINFQG
jgi:hypothetical protein